MHGMLSGLIGRSGQEERRKKVLGSPGRRRWKQESVSAEGTAETTANSERMPLYDGSECTTALTDTLCPSAKLSEVFTDNPITERMTLEERKACTESARLAHTPLNHDRATPVDTLREALTLVQEERIEVEVWTSLMDDLGESQATVKRLEGAFEDMERKFEEQRVCLHKLESNQQEVGERCNALEGHMDRLSKRCNALQRHMERLSKHCGLLTEDLETLLSSIEQRSSLQHTEEAHQQFQTQLSGFAVQLEEAQLANERWSQQLQEKTSELQAQVLVNDVCLENHFKAEIVQWQCSLESLTQQLVEFHAKSERGCSASGAPAGGQAHAFVDDACSALEARLMGEIVQCKCSQQSLSEQLADLNASHDCAREPSPLESCVHELLTECCPRNDGSQSKMSAPPVYQAQGKWSHSSEGKVEIQPAVTGASAVIFHPTAGNQTMDTSKLLMVNGSDYVVSRVFWKAATNLGTVALSGEGRSELLCR